MKFSDITGRENAPPPPRQDPAESDTDPAMPAAKLKAGMGALRGKGTKHDAGKPRYSLIPSGFIREVIAVLEGGAAAHGVENWKQLDSPRDRFGDALWRHFQSWRDGETHDPDTGHHHLAHAAVNCAFLMWFDFKEGR